MCTCAPLKPCKLGELFNFEALQMSGGTHFLILFKLYQRNSGWAVGFLSNRDLKVWMSDSGSTISEGKGSVDETVLDFSAPQDMLHFKKGQWFLRFWLELLVLLPRFQYRRSLGGGLEKQEKACCGEVGTFKNIVACHHKMIDDTNLTVSRLNND